MVTLNSQNSSLTYNCESCYYSTNSKGDFNKHILSAKHKKITKGDIKSTKIHSCVCGKEFKYRQGLSRHKQTCKETNELPSIPTIMSSIIENPSLVIELLRQNQEFKDLILEERREFQKIITDQSAKMMEVYKTLLIK